MIDPIGQAAKRTCFVISPIGDADSPTRRNADDVFELLIEPALEPFHFEVVRADKVAGSLSITENILKLVQESDLCIVDLTEHNPNVFYECGRRHETGKPTILIIKKGEKIPFDLADIRTVPYDLTDARSTRKSAIALQDYVRAAQDDDFKESRSSASLSGIMEILVRVERKLERMQTGTAAPAAAQGRGFKDLFTNPQQAFQRAVMEGDIASVVALLPRMEALLGMSQTLLTAAGLAAISGERAGADLLLRALAGNMATLDIDSIKVALTSLVQYYIATDREEEGVSELRPHFEAAGQRDDLAPEDKAYVYNQRQMIEYGAKHYEEALSSAEQAIRLKPGEPAYYYNVSLVYEGLKLPRKALEAIEKCLAISTKDDAQHLSQAYDIYLQNGLRDKAAQVLARLQSVDPSRAAFIQRVHSDRM